MPIIKLPNGVIKEVSPDEAEGLLASGGELVETPTVTPFGERSVAELGIADGGREVDPQDDAIGEILAGRKAYMEEQGAAAFGYGLADSLTAGLLSFDGKPQEIREANPLANAAGVGLGLVGGAVTGFGAPGAAAKLGAGAARGISSQVGRMALEGSLDALSYATARETIGAVVHDKPFSAEAIATEGLIGGGIGGALGAAAKGAGALRKALTREDIAKEAVTKAMSGLDAPVPAQAIDGVPAVADDFASELPAPGSMTTEVPAGGRSIDITPNAKLENPREFFRSWDYTRKADEDLKSIWKEIDTLEDDIARMPGDHPLFEELNAEWRSLKSERAAVAKKVGGTQTTKARISELQRDIARWELPDAPISSKMDPRKTVANQELIDSFQSVIQTARRIDDKLAEARRLGKTYSHIDIAEDVRGGGVRLDEKMSLAEKDAAVAARREAYAKEIAGRERAPSDDIIREIFARDTGSLADKLEHRPNNVSNLKQFRDLPKYERTFGERQTKRAAKDAELGYTVPQGWDKTNARPLETIKRSVKAGEPPHLDELLMLDATEQRALLDSLSQRHIDSLAAEAANNPKILAYNPVSQPAAKSLASARASVSTELEMNMLMSRLEPPDAPQTPRPKLHESAESIPGTDGIPSAPSTGIGVIDSLRKANLTGLMLAGMFPKMAVAKAIVEKYGARISGAAERALSSQKLGIVARKIPMLPWASVLAPGGKDHDRNIRAVYEAAKNPEAFDSAIEAAMLNIDADNPEKMVEARERISTNLQYLIRNMPPTLSALKPVWSTSSIAAFNLLMTAFADPIGVFERAKTAPTEQLNAARDMYPETYMHWMTELVNKVSEAAAEGKPIPREIGRFLPMASPSWSPDGMGILQTVTTSKTEPAGDTMNSSVMAPQTEVESMSANRIGLNK